jgi:hypothetical protein
MFFRSGTGINLSSLNARYGQTNVFPVPSSILRPAPCFSEDGVILSKRYDQDANARFKRDKKAQQAM